MAHLANCPQCDCELLVLEDADPSSLAKCPKCRAFFELHQAKSREIPVLTVVDPRPAAVDPSAATISEISSKSTWAVEPTESDQHLAAESADLEPLEFDSSSQETPEAAAQRIEDLLRSANLLEEDSTPAQERSAPAGHQEKHERDSSAASRATIDISSHELEHDASSDDFELEPSPESQHEEAAWDDSPHMERLLAETENQPLDELEMSDEQLDEPVLHEEHAPQFSDASPDALPQVQPRGKAPRKRSLVRTLVLTVSSGIIGLALGYYALLWLRGPSGDIGDIAKYLPQAILPSSFHAKPKERIATLPPRPPADTADTAPADATPPSVSDASEPPAEKQANFNEPAEPKAMAKSGEEGSAGKNAVGDVGAPSEPPATEPAKLDEPPASSVTEITPPNKAPVISNAPSFTGAELSAALQAAEKAKSGLSNGSLTDGREVQRAKGFSYGVLADLAQKSLFVPASEAAAPQAEADELFRKVLADEHTRSEVAQIVPKWIASPNRRHGGIFFAGSVKSSVAKGAVTECSVDLGAGPSLTVLVPTGDAAAQANAPGMVVIAGWIVDAPAQHIDGYSGDTQQAVYARNLIPLE
jgi:hypothetical protein